MANWYSASKLQGNTKMQSATAVPVSFESVNQFLEMLLNPPAGDVETGSISAKARLILNTSTGDISWHQAAQEKKVWNVTQFDVVLKAVVGKIETAKRALQTVPNEQSREGLQQIIPKVKKALSDRLSRFDKSHNGWFSCYYWKGMHTQVLALQGILNTQIEALAAHVAKVPLASIPPPPPPMNKEFKKPAAKQQPASEPTSTPPQEPTSRPRAKSDARQYAPSIGDISKDRLKRAVKK